MQIRMLLISLALLFVSTTTIFAQYSKEETANKRFFVGSSLFITFNALLKEEKHDFAQLNFGYRLTQKDVVGLEVKTWRYFEPLGIPYGEAKSDPNENLSGSIREKGFALVYQRFWWKGLYTGLHVMNAWQSFLDEGGEKFDTGFQIFNTYRLGYHVKLFKRKFFLEPAMAITHRPYHTEMPESFKVMDDKWSKFFFWEPGFHFGFNF